MRFFLVFEGKLYEFPTEAELVEFERDHGIT